MELDIKWTNLLRVLNEYADRVIDLARQHLQENGSIVTGELFNSIEKIVEIEDDYYSVKISLADYWKYVEEGRRPGKFPPPDAIRNWIEIKPVSIQPDENGKYPTVEQLTFLISRKIAQEGTEPHPFLQTAAEEALREFELSIEYAIEEDVKEYIEENVTEWMKDVFGGK